MTGDYMSQIGICFLDRPDGREQVRLAQRADREGWHSVRVCETRTARDAISVLGAMAATTERIKLGPGVVNTWTRGPVLMALTFASLDEMAPDRSSAVGAGGTRPLPDCSIVTRLGKTELLSLRVEVAELQGTG